MTPPQNADELREQAKQAEERADYGEAHRLWMLAAAEFDRVGDGETFALLGQSGASRTLRMSG